MPVCVKCGRNAATAEFRRRRNHPGEYLCLDMTACGRRVAQPRVDVTAAVRELDIKLRDAERELTATLRAAREPLTFRELAQLADITEGDVRRRIA